MATYTDILQLSDFRSLATYCLGLLIIVMYAKDKFNMPTYDRESIGPFAQLPPQFLTIDSRYQWGRTVYVLLLAALYTAISIIGPTIFNFDQSNANQTKLSLVASAQTWQAAAATFLISTGAAQDDSLLGRIELFIRQYAHKIAYVPGAVSDLAFSLRNFKVGTWLLKDPSIDDARLAERRSALTALVGEEGIRKFEQNPELEDETTAFLRANILFLTLNQIFNKSPGISNPRLDHLTDLRENREAFERLKNTQRNLLTQISTPGKQERESPDHLYAEIQRFAREVSLTIAVLLSRTARNGSDLAHRLDELGFPSANVNNSSDHVGYVSLVNAFILFGGFVSGLLLSAPMLSRTFGVDWTNRYLLLGLLAILTALLVYIVTFRVLDYSRDKLLDAQAWKESLESYSTVALSASILSSVICIVSATLVLTLFNCLQYVAYNLVSFVAFVMFNTVVAAVGTGFGLLYFRQAARLPRARLSFLGAFFNGTAFAHACLAALLVGVLNSVFYMYQVSTSPKEIYSRIMADFAALQPIIENKPDDAMAIYSVLSPGDLKPISRSLAKLGRLLNTNPDHVEAQLKEISTICLSLNAKFENQSRSSGDADDSAHLFDDPKDCTIGTLLSSHLVSNRAPPAGSTDIAIQKQVATSRNEGLFSSFVFSLPLLHTSIRATKGDGGSKIAAFQIWVFPTVVAFTIAFCFGVGCRHWRAWWLYNEANRADGRGQKLRELLLRSYGPELDFEKCLVFRIPSLGNLTPLEAIRYEDYCARLFAKVQRRQIEWIGCGYEHVGDSNLIQPGIVTA
ncbi:hypothetical protein [Bradyrhizobium yuanmingense]|uniref:hypothetical protein n=1 Tax=Bradyrhizobium yuanmingense TaxID=108015 RepID=UPI0023B949BC|nr:hypothetical protein [Bradyrhizobium yuanmingense]MDF0492471.1 hypothetical protein [Bradyrhizobium yuanmingense]